MGKDYSELIGKIFGRWKILKVDYDRNEKENKRVKDGEIKYNHHFLICECQCDKKTIKSVCYKNIKNGTSTSCGCYKKEINSINGKMINKKYNKYDLNNEYGIGYTQSGYEFYFDKEDYDLINQYCWHKHQDGYLRTCYGKKENGGNKYILMHRLIMVGIDKDINNDIDHINGKPNDNRKENMRIISHADNMKNIKIYSTNNTGYKGVYYNKKEGKYKVSISSKHIGTFNTLEEAIIARKIEEEKRYGKFNRNEEDLDNGTR